MINSKCYQLNAEIFFGTLASEKQSKAKTVLNRISSRVLATFPVYLNDFANISGKLGSEFSALESDERLNLIGCYKNETQSSRYVKGKIFEVQPTVLKDLCPYCMLDRPRTLDHYVPKDEFPEYAMLVRNLVPCCYDCNNKKDELWRAGLIRQFIHYYNDSIFTHQFLYSSLVFDHQAPLITHYLRRPEGMLAQEFSIVEAHFSNLNLLNAYDSRINNVLSTEIETIKNFVALEMTDAQISRTLEIRFNGLRNSHGVNYFETVLYQTLNNHLQQIKLLNLAP